MKLDQHCLISNTCCNFVVADLCVVSVQANNQPQIEFWLNVVSLLSYKFNQITVGVQMYLF